MNTLTVIIDPLYSVDELHFVRILIQLDIELCTGTVRYDCHLYTVWTKVGESICKSCDKAFFCLEILLSYATGFVHKDSQFAFAT